MAEISFEDFGKTISNAAEAVGKKTEEFIGIQKLRGQIHSAERSIEKNYKDLGEIIFRRYSLGGDVDEEIAIICEEISQINANISELKEELANKRGRTVCPVCEAAVPQEAIFCMKCGAPMPEAVPENPADDTVDIIIETKDIEILDDENTAEAVKENIHEDVKL